MPARQRHLRRAPITEAVLDLRVKASRTFDPAILEQLKPQLADRFPSVEARRGGKITFQLTPSGTQPANVEDMGLQAFLFRSTDNLTVAQFRTDGFALNRLRPYTDWSEFFTMAVELWNLYQMKAQPEAVIRVGLRYINQLSLPSRAPLAQYISTTPAIPPVEGLVINAFFSRITVVDSSRGIAAHVAQVLEGEPGAGHATLVFDIDAFKEGSWSPSAGEIKDILQELHELKNRIFFSSLTDSILEQYE